MLLFPWIAFGAGLSGMEVLQRTAEAYKALRSYEVRVRVQTVQGANVSVRHLKEAGLRPGKYRIEEEGGRLRVGDGATEWQFDPAAKEYRKHPSGSGTCTSAAFEQIDQDVRTAATDREAQLTVNGKPVPVYVVNVIRDRWPAGCPDVADFTLGPAGTRMFFPATYQIDKKNFVVHKVSKSSQLASQISLYSDMKWNQPAPESLFVFEPPPNARLVSAFSTVPAESMPIVGREAPDFTLSDPAGRPVNLQKLRGKVLIVDFWATWCGPCRELMPQLQTMHRQLANKGLIVLGLNMGEDAATVAKFARAKGYTFRLLLGAEPDVSAKFFVTGFPTTFVIDRQGRIASRETGVSAVENLRPVVEAAIHADHR